jgi:UDP-N-acetyl-D-mannosaminuronate dehydrogenase
LGHRSVHQRQQIRKAYEELFEEDLIKRLESEISGDFEVKYSNTRSDSSKVINSLYTIKRVISTVDE